MFKRLRSLFAGRASPVGKAFSVDPRELFAAEVAAFLRSVPGVSKVNRAPGDFALEWTTPTGTHGPWHLENVFAETREMSPEKRRERISFFFESFVTADHDDPWEEARETLVPALRGSTYGIELWMKEREADFIRRPFLPHIDLVVAVDRPTSMRFVSRVTVARWKVAEEDVFEAAAARVHLLADPNLELYAETHGPLWMVTSDDTYESSRLLVPGWLESFRGKVDGNPIAIIPERATLLVGGDGRPEMVARLLEKAEREFNASTRRLSPALYTVDGSGGVVPWVLPAGNPLAAKLKIAHEKLALYEHQQQKESLDALYEKNGPDVFIASYQVFEGANGNSPHSVSVWTKGVRTYLPRTEKVMLFAPGDQKGASPKATVEVPFEAIEQRLTAVPDLHPPRFETPGEFPGTDELRAFGHANLGP